MNSFRVTILAMLALVLGLMFYIITVYLPDQQEQYRVYQAMSQQQDYQAQQAAHENRMKDYAANTESEVEAQARQAAEERAKQLEAELNAAEERSVLAAAKRKEEAAMARAAAQEAQKPKALGAVTAFDADWNALLFTPAPDAQIQVGAVIAVSREGKLVCEAVVDHRDEQSGQFSATVKPVKMNDSLADIPAENFIPRAGDGVIHSPLPQLGPSNNLSSPSASSEFDGQHGNGVPEEVEANWIPMP